MDNQQASEKWFQDSASHAIHAEQLERVERFNGRAAMLGFVIGVLTEAITGQGIIHQIGLGPLVDGYAACSTKFLPFCF
ncbi:high light inducible protein [Synechococcus sp. NOUM97013]|uniref:high light inducible protein n=1 Tax=Synechococcus sp. NOUM97013 TaxID=1442555 RepID=UPI00164776DD|nr:high light inducible protein [Synechococcus sp. NOUM97013]QNI73943.1 high light inducible protein [Synechococcus sp. NOUM97013]